MFRLILFTVFVMCCAAQTEICELDIAFIIDASGSIWADQLDQAQGQRNWEAVRMFLANLIADFTAALPGPPGPGDGEPGPVGPDVNGVAAIIFEDAGDTALLFNLGERTPTEMINIMSTLPYDQTGGVTRMDIAMEILNRDVFVTSNPGNSPTAQDIGIVVTDGRITEGYEPATIDYVNSMKARDVEFITVGVTNQTDIEELQKIASNDGAVFSVDQFDQLEGLLGQIQDRACSIGGRCPNPDPNAVAFSALLNNNGMLRYTDGMVMPFGRTLVNVGDDFDIATYTFTCPCRGMYEFHLTMSYIHHGLYAAIMKGMTVVSPIAYTNEGAMSTTTIIFCDATETVHAQIMHASGMDLMPCLYEGASFAGFTGKLLFTVN